MPAVPQQLRKPPPSLVIEAAEQVAGVDRGTLAVTSSKQRSGPVATARQLAACVLRQGGWSLWQIANHVGYRSHSTVVATLDAMGEDSRVDQVRRLAEELAEQHRDIPSPLEQRLEKLELRIDLLEKLAAVRSEG
jgi:hypothetical protein